MFANSRNSFRQKSGTFQADAPEELLGISQGSPRRRSCFRRFSSRYLAKCCRARAAPPPAGGEKTELFRSKESCCFAMRKVNLDDFLEFLLHLILAFFLIQMVILVGIFGDFKQI